jgi:hypothetical protein
MYADRLWKWDGKGGRGGGGKSQRVEVVDVERGNVVWSWLLFRYYPVSRIPLMALWNWVKA